MKTNFLVALLAIILVGCASSSASTNVSSSWKNPSSTASINTMNKILVVALSNNDLQRRTMEDAFVKNLQGKAIPSYSYFNVPLSQIDKQTAVSQLSNDGYNGAIVIRLANHQTTGSSRPPSVSLSPSLYYGFGRNLSAGIGLDFHTGYNNQQTIYTIETSVYQFPNDELIWSGIVNANNPSDINSLSQTVANTVFSKMKTDGVY